MPRLAPTTANIRPITAADLPHIHQLIADIYDEYGITLVLTDPAEHHLADPQVYFRKTGGEFWVVADAAGSIFATVAVKIGTDDPTDAELKSMYVRRDHRRTGWATLLLDRVKNHARQNGCTRLFAWSDTRFTRAHRMYDSAGFTRCGQRDIEDSNNTTEFAFVLAL